VTNPGRPDLRDQLQATLGSTFTLEHELTGGAMARVFSATDTALARRIVVKVLSPELSEGVSGERFAREIRIAASLQQANIVPVIATGETNGLPYYTMPFVEGLSLRERLKRDGAMSIRDAVSVMRDVARALAFAHERGVVHRDIKPENVLLSGDAAVVTDFGIAKAISEARTSTSVDGTDTALTSAGVSLGTPAYMAPEQISADTTADHRADVYSFGCLAFELIAGRTPFQGRTARELFASHLTETPASLSDVRRDCPSPIASLVTRCLAKDPADRPQSARELLVALDPLTAPRASSAVSRWMGSGRRPVLIVGTVIAVLLAAVVARPLMSPSGVTQSIAVLPLTNVGGDSAQEYLADGMTDELATAFGKMPGLRVASRSLARRYQGRRDVDVREAGRALDVKYVLQGTVRRVGDKLRVSAQLTNAGDGVEVWSDSYDRGVGQVFSLQDDITRAVAAALRLDPRRSAVAVQGTTDPEAYDLYLRGQFLLRRRGPGVAKAAENFESAIARDSMFARAYAGLGAALELFPYFVSTAPAAVRDRATAAARRALALDSTLAEAHTALGLALMHSWDWDAAGAEFRKGVETEPTDPSAHHQYGRFLLYVARHDSALAEFRRAKSIDPFSSLYSGWIGTTLAILDRPTEALVEIKRALEIDSLNAPSLQYAPRIFLQQGDTASALSAARRLPTFAPWNGITAYSYAQAGDRATAQRILRSLRGSPDEWFAQTGIAYASLGLGDTAQALTALERATERGEIWPSFTAVDDSMFDSVRSSARFAALLRRVGLALAPR
jgi:eukaryotic-like serine/threonine-protein kinase